MISGKKVLALIPARGGSKGIKDKNIREVQGKPLISYTIDAAKESKYIDKTVVSTDSERIKLVAECAGASVPFLRPPELAVDSAKTIDAVLHAIETLESLGDKFDILVLLQPTSPLRDGKDIDRAIEVFEENGELPLASVSEVCEHPILIRMIKKDRMEKLLNMGSSIRRQDMPSYFRINGGIYIDLIKNVSPETSFNDSLVPYIMDKEHSVDVDEELDIEIVNYYLKNSERA